MVKKLGRTFKKKKSRINLPLFLNSAFLKQKAPGLGN